MNTYTLTSEYKTSDGSQPTVQCESHSIPFLRTDADGLGNRCAIHFVRNPLEMVVSGYLYDQAASEDWMTDNATFEEIIAKNEPCDPLLVNCGISESTQCQQEFRKNKWPGYPEGHHRSVAQVYRCSQSGPMSDLLPAARLKETFPEYLQRVDVDAGLIAQVIWASDDSLAPMDYINPNTQAWTEKTGERIAGLCFADMYTSCPQTWHRSLLHTLEPPHPHLELLTQAASKSCPDRSVTAGYHSSTNQQSEQGLEHPPVDQLVVRLRELDRKHFSGMLNEMEKRLDCGLGAKYDIDAQTSG